MPWMTSETLTRKEQQEKMPSGRVHEAGPAGGAERAGASSSQSHWECPPRTSLPHTACGPSPVILSQPRQSSCLVLWWEFLAWGPWYCLEIGSYTPYWEEKKKTLKGERTGKATNLAELRADNWAAGEEPGSWFQRSIWIFTDFGPLRPQQMGRRSQDNREFPYVAPKEKSVGIKKN